MSQCAALKIAKVYDKFRGQQNTNMADGWSAVFSAPIGSAVFFEGLQGVSAAFRRFEFELEMSSASDRAKALYAKAAERLEPFSLVQHLGGMNVDQVKKQSDSIDLMFLAADVTHGLPEAAVNPVTLDTISNSLMELLAEIDTVEMDTSLRQFLKVQIGNMLQAVTCFDAIGIEGLSRIYGATVSEITRAWGMKEAKEPSARNWISKAGKALKLIGAGVVWVGAVAGGADSAIEHSTNLLEFAGAIEGDAGAAQAAQP